MQAHTVLAAELVDGVDEAVVQIGRPSEARHLGPVVLPHSPAPLPADHRRPHHGHLLVSAPTPSYNTKNLPSTGSRQLIYLVGWPATSHARLCTC